VKVPRGKPNCFYRAWNRRRGWHNRQRRPRLPREGANPCEGITGLGLDLAADRRNFKAKHKVATPVNWKHGEDVIIAGSVTDEDAGKQYPQGWKAPKPYIRIVPQPRE